MALKRPRALARYRTSADELPSAQVDAFVLAAARVRRPAARKHRIALVAVGAAFASFYVLLTPTPPVTRADLSDFGIAEGRDDVYLMYVDFQKPNGPGSQEGLP